MLITLPVLFEVLPFFYWRTYFCFLTCFSYCCCFLNANILEYLKVPVGCCVSLGIDFPNGFGVERRHFSTCITSMFPLFTPLTQTVSILFFDMLFSFPPWKLYTLHSLCLETSLPIFAFRSPGRLSWPHNSLHARWLILIVSHSTKCFSFKAHIYISKCIFTFWWYN